MNITTDKGERIKTTEIPTWNEMHKCFYASGFRWIKTRQKWSGSHLIHNFKSFEEEKQEAA